MPSRWDLTEEMQLLVIGVHCGCTPLWYFGKDQIFIFTDSISDLLLPLAKAECISGYFQHRKVSLRKSVIDTGSNQGDRGQENQTEYSKTQSELQSKTENKVNSNSSGQKTRETRITKYSKNPRDIRKAKWIKRTRQFTSFRSQDRSFNYIIHQFIMKFNPRLHCGVWTCEETWFLYVGYVFS